MKQLKRFFDISFSLLLLIVLALPFAVVCLGILIDDGKPVFFHQERVGKDGKPFVIYKFRTMRLGTPNCATNDLDNAHEYITRMGRFLRKTSLDELPQLYNVLNGSMSLIGPRPLAVMEAEAHELRKKYGVYSVRPGLTGLAQINGRDDLNVEQKVEYDRQYVEHYSLWLDIKILWKTVWVVLSKEGIRDGK